MTILKRLVRQPDGTFRAEPYRKTDDGAYVPFRKKYGPKWIAKMEDKWKADKKRTKAEARHGRRRAPLFVIGDGRMPQQCKGTSN